MDVLGPMYVVSGPTVHCIIQLSSVWDIHRLRARPSIVARPLISPVCYALGMPWCTTRPLGIRESIDSVFGCSCVDWCATSLVRESIRLAMAVQHIE